MANRALTADVIAKEAVTILENTCVMGGLVYRGYEDEFKKVNGYEKGDTISIRARSTSPFATAQPRSRRTCRKASSP
jgi:hypothetical protein